MDLNQRKSMPIFHLYSFI